MESSTWLLLLYGLPAKRTTARVNLWRKLKKFGAIQLKTSAYVLPDDSVQYERFQWLSREIRDADGEAAVMRVSEIEGMGNEDIVRLFNQARAADYGGLIGTCRKILAGHKRGREGLLATEFEKQQRQFREIREVDYFQSPAGHDAQMAMQRIEKLLAPEKSGTSRPRLDPRRFAGKTWLTRPRPGIDRAGSAWLIRKFIDPKARFVFAQEPLSYPRALPFDMADGEFTHHGDDCTFETLVKRFGIADKAALKIAEMVHDADLEDGKFQRCECLGVNAVLSGWARTKITDAELLAKGMECFEGLYQQVRK
jgi:hypothetical protein